MALELLSDQGFRVDGRKADEIRRVRCKLNVFTQADGSAYIEQGNTKVLAAVYGPREAKHRQKTLHDRAILNCQYSMATFSTGERKRRPRGDRKSQEMGLHLERTLAAAALLTLYPRSQIDVYVEVLQADGGNICACLNAATLALIDAGVPIRDYVVACSVGLFEDTPVTDLSHLEETMGGATLHLAVLPRSEQVVYLEMTSRLHQDHLDKVMEAGLRGCAQVHQVLDQVVRDHVGAEAAAALIHRK